jgi:putative PIN family toxin of toxin-antitoxin system
VRRVVLDVNVYVSALLAPAGSPGQILERWADDHLDVIVSPLLLAELERVLRRPKFKGSIPAVQIDALLSALSEESIAATDPETEPGTTPDPGDDYLVSLARAVDPECIVSGDTHLTQLVDAQPPVLTPREFLTSLG